MRVIFEIKRICILRGFGPDKIALELEGESPFPAMGYTPEAQIETQAGLAEEWLRGMGIDPSQAEIVTRQK